MRLSQDRPRKPDCPSSAQGDDISVVRSGFQGAESFLRSLGRRTQGTEEQQVLWGHQPFASYTRAEEGMTEPLLPATQSWWWADVRASSRRQPFTITERPVPDRTLTRGIWMPPS